MTTTEHRPGLRPHLTHYRRDQRRQAVHYVRPGDPVPAAFATHRKTSAAAAAFTRASEAWMHHTGEAIRLRAEADAAAARYAEQLSAAFSKGKSATGIVNAEADLRAQAAAHDDLATRAHKEATEAGAAFGDLIATHATDLYPDADAQLEAAAQTVRGAVDTLRGAWSQWSQAWSARYWLSQAATVGGWLYPFTPDTDLPADVAKALGVLIDRLGDLEALRHDEAEIAAFRAEQRSA